jgi:hypothetical protein
MALARPPPLVGAGIARPRDGRSPERPIGGGSRRPRRLSDAPSRGSSRRTARPPSSVLPHKGEDAQRSDPRVTQEQKALGLRRAKRERNIADGQLRLGKRAKYCDLPLRGQYFDRSAHRGDGDAGSVDLGDDACWLRQHRRREISRSGRGALESAFRRGSTILRKRSSRTYRTDACQVNLGSLCPASRSWTFASSQSRSISLRLAPSGVWPPSAKRISI